jgi:hypothetical protein
MASMVQHFLVVAGRILIRDNQGGASQRASDSHEAPASVRLAHGVVALAVRSVAARGVDDSKGLQSSHKIIIFWV